MFGEKSAMQIM